MKWKSKYAEIPQEKVLGAERVLRRFAWLPKRIGTERVWLTRYEELERVCNVSFMTDVTSWGTGGNIYETPEWVVVARRLPFVGSQFIPMEREVTPAH